MPEPTPLSLATLSDLGPKVATPRYGREALSPGIVHIGVGNFHRAHQAVYLDELMNAGRDRDWAVIGAGVRPADARMRETLAAQDWLSTVVEMAPERTSARVTGVMTDFAPVGETAEGLVAALSDPAIRICSLTVTEGGWCLDSEGNFDPNHPDIRRDAANPAAPRTAFGAIAAALAARRSAGVPPFTVMSCDNIPGNGHVARAVIGGLADMMDPTLGAHVSEAVAFPDSMVDRITPATGERERARIRDEFGVADAWPVFCEPFRQWVLEDTFVAGRPRFEDAGVTIVSDVRPFELMKLRILNGSHAAIAYPAALLGLTFVHEAMEHPLVRAFLERLAREEIIPEVPPVPGTDLTAYFDEVCARFANPAVGDTIARLCQDGSNRQPKFILPSTRARLEAGRTVDGLALESALWCRYCGAVDEAGRSFALDDPHADSLHAAATAARELPDAFLALDRVFDRRIAQDSTFRERFAFWLGTLWNEGTARALERYTDR